MTTPMTTQETTIATAPLAPTQMPESNDYFSYVKKIIGTPTPTDWIKKLETAIMRDHGLVLEIEQTSTNGLDGMRFILKTNLNSNHADPFVRKYRGLIGYTDAPYDIACMPLPMTLNVKDDVLDQEVLKAELKAHEKNLTIYPLFDATLIRMVKFENGYTISTTKKIEAENAKWYSPKSFYDLFKECASVCQFDPTSMQLGRTYLFLLIHPENKMVLGYNYYAIIHLMTIDNSTSLEVVDNLPNVVDQKEVKGVSIDSVFSILNAPIPLNTTFIGYIVKDRETGKIYRFDTKTFTTAKSFQYNQPSILYRFVKNYQEGTLNQYLSYFPDQTELFSKYLTDINELIDTIHWLYQQLHVMGHPTMSYDKTFSRFIYDLHGHYLKELKPRHMFVTRERVDQFIKKSDIPRVGFLMSNFSHYTQSTVPST